MVTGQGKWYGRAGVVKEEWVGEREQRGVKEKGERERVEVGVGFLGAGDGGRREGKGAALPFLGFSSYLINSPQISQIK